MLSMQSPGRDGGAAWRYYAIPRPVELVSVLPSRSSPPTMGRAADMIHTAPLDATPQVGILLASGISICVAASGVPGRPDSLTPGKHGALIARSAPCLFVERFRHTLKQVWRERSRKKC